MGGYDGTPWSQARCSIFAIDTPVTSAGSLPFNNEETWSSNELKRGGCVAALGRGIVPP